MTNINITEGDRRPSIRAQLYSSSGPLDLTAATGVKFQMGRNGVTKVDAAAVIENAASGVVRYDWAANDTSIPGDFLAQFEVTWGTGITSKVPNNGWLRVVVQEAAKG